MWKSWFAPSVGSPVMTRNGGNWLLFSGNNSALGTLTLACVYWPIRLSLIRLLEKLNEASLTMVGPNVLVRLTEKIWPGTFVVVVAMLGSTGAVPSGLK